MSIDNSKPAAEAAGSLKALESFVVDNDDLLALEARIGRFNIFDALGIARVEIRHSNFFAFILDPRRGARAPMACTVSLEQICRRFAEVLARLVAVGPGCVLPV